MSFVDKKRKLKAQIGEGATVEVLNTLQDMVHEHREETLNDLYQYQARYNTNEKKHLANLLDERDYQQELARINHALLIFLDELTETDLRQDTEEAIAALGVHLPPPLPPAALVNCNRQAAFGAFESAYDQQCERPSQFYFFAGCPTQKPASFAERIIYEIVHEVLADNRTAIFYETVAETIGTRQVERLLVRPLPYAKLGSNEANQARFQRCVAEVLDLYLPHLGNHEQPLSVTQLVEMPAGQVPVQLFTLAFRIDFAEISWGDKLRDYLRWIITTFHQRRHNPPAFQFVFVVQANDHHQQPDASVQALHQFVQSLNAELNGGEADRAWPCAWSEEFRPVSTDDLYNWLRLRYRGNPDLSALRRSVGQFADQLRRNERMGSDNSLDMNDAEEFTKMVYVASHARTT
jgi:Effector-associated domain 11